MYILCHFWKLSTQTVAKSISFGSYLNTFFEVTRKKIYIMLKQKKKKKILTDLG